MEEFNSSDTTLHLVTRPFLQSIKQSNKFYVGFILQKEGQ